jgi:dTMP kinase
VISDRSVYSSLAYQGGGRRLGIDAVRSVNEPGLVDVWPQLVVLLRVDPATGLRRQRIADRIGREGVEFQQRVADAFDHLAAAEPGRFVVVDADRPFGDVVAVVLEEIGGRP